jgi:hypothetical protein
MAAALVCGSSNPSSIPGAIAPGVSIVIENQEMATRIAADAKRVYWLSSRSHVRSCEKSNCARTIVTYEVSNAHTRVAFSELAVQGREGMSRRLRW